MSSQKPDSASKTAAKKPPQEAYVPRPDLGESGDVNAMPSESRGKQQNSKTDGSQTKQGQKNGA